MTHLSSAEIETWYEQGTAADRARVIGHLAECETCRKALSAYAAAAEPGVLAPLVSMEEAVPRGYAAKSATTHVPARSSGWWRPLYGLAAAAVLVIAIVWVAVPDRAIDDDTVRGSDLQGLSPLGSSNASEFRFASPFRASRYRLTVRDASGAQVLTADADDMRVAVDAATRSRLVAGQEYSWVVIALDAAGETIAESAPVRFRYQP
jgi:hypothetical protein